MDRVFTQEYDNIDTIFEEVCPEFRSDSHKVKTFMLNSNHDIVISHRISGEKIYGEKKEDDQDRIMRYLSYCRLI